MNKLELVFNRKQYPYLDESDGNMPSWGEIILLITSNRGLLKEVFKIEWDLKELVKWLMFNKSDILYETFPFEYNKKASIAEVIYNFYNTSSDLADDIVEIMYDYRSKHGIRFGLRGVDIDDVYIGQNNGVTEVSCFTENKTWSFEIDINSFFEDLEQYCDDLDFSE